MIFRCKNCGGNVVYSPERKKMFCPFCESEDSEEREDGVIETSGEENGTAEGTVQAAGAGQPVSRMAAAEGAAQKKVTKVCRYGIITTNGKSLYFQGVHAFAVIYSIPFPS